MHQAYCALHCIASHSCSFPLARPTWRGLPPHALGFIPLRAVPSCSAITIHNSIEHLLISPTPCMSLACPILHVPSPLQSPIPNSQQHPTNNIQHPTPSIILNVHLRNTYFKTSNPTYSDNCVEHVWQPDCLSPRSNGRNLSSSRDFSLGSFQPYQGSCR